jgi:hypothetical protein
MYVSKQASKQVSLCVCVCVCVFLIILKYMWWNMALFGTQYANYNILIYEE